MAALYKAHMLQVDREHVAVYFDAISPMICFEAFEFAVKESIRQHERFPKVPQLLELARRWRKPIVQDITRAAIPADTTPPDEAARLLAEILGSLDEKIGTSFGSGSFDEEPDRQRLRVVK